MFKKIVNTFGTKITAAVINFLIAVLLSQVLGDTGKGIAPNLQKKIFQPGFSTKQRGWGLGLSLSKRIVEQYHHGRLFLKYSLPGQGTVFRLVLRK